MIVHTHAARDGFPVGHEVELTGRGRTFVREVAGPPGAPTVILLHGWTATADLNWFTCFAPLGEHFRVLAPDHRGHGRGIRPNGGFRLTDCADDVAAIADVFGVNTFIPVGYSMGGAIAQLVALRHEARTRGLVLAATAGYFASSRDERLNFLGLTGLARLSRLTTAQARSWVTEQVYLQRKTHSLADWAARQIANQRPSRAAATPDGARVHVWHADGDAPHRSWSRRRLCRPGPLCAAVDRRLPTSGATRQRCLRASLLVGGLNRIAPQLFDSLGE
jgi:pimeloyl-ACP methyl ester carboxylesterase